MVQPYQIWRTAGASAAGWHLIAQMPMKKCDLGSSPSSVKNLHKPTMLAPLLRRVSKPITGNRNAIWARTCQVAAFRAKLWSAKSETTIGVALDFTALETRRPSGRLDQRSAVQSYEQAISEEPMFHPSPIFRECLLTA